MNDDHTHMATAVAAAARARHRASPNPWVGAAVVGPDGTVVTGATQAFGGAHAEVTALAAASDPSGATVYTTLEPCNHIGKTRPCTDALIDAGVARVVIGIEDPDPQVAGSGIARLRKAGIGVVVGVGAADVEQQLRPYLHHRRNGRPWVLLKLAVTIDGRVAAPDGSSQWITGPAALTDAHRLRAESDAILVGAGTVRADDPALTVRYWPGPDDGIDPAEVRDPCRIVLGVAPLDARVRPCTQYDGPLPDLLDQLGAEGVVQLMVEGGPRVAHVFHHAGLVDQYVIHMAPALFGGSDAAGMFAGAGVMSTEDVWRGRIEAVATLGDDLRVDMIPRRSRTGQPGPRGSLHAHAEAGPPQGFPRKGDA